VVGVLVAMLAMGVSARQLSMHNVRDDRVDVSAKPGGNLDRAAALTIADMRAFAKMPTQAARHESVIVLAQVHKRPITRV